MHFVLMFTFFNSYHITTMDICYDIFINIHISNVVIITFSKVILILTR